MLYFDFHVLLVQMFISCLQFFHLYLYLDTASMSHHTAWSIMPHTAITCPLIPTLTAPRIGKKRCWQVQRFIKSIKEICLLFRISTNNPQSTLGLLKKIFHRIVAQTKHMFNDGVNSIAVFNLFFTSACF